MAPWIILKFLILFLAGVSLAVDKDLFKTCSESGFCTRLRKLSPQDLSYTVLMNTITFDNYSLTAELKNNKANVNFILNVTGLVDNTFRIAIDEKQSLHPRYVMNFALDGLPIKYKLTLIERNDDTVKLENGLGYQMTIHANPFKIDVADWKNELVLTINGKGLTTVEHLRSKPENGTEWGEWEESFGIFNDSKPRGPEAISTDITFPKASHLYGLPEHTDGFTLKPTEDGDPYRLYNADVPYHDVDSRMALYANIPVLYAHGPSGETVGVFWANVAETWVDIETESKPWAHFMSEAGILDMYVMLGPRPTDTFRQYTRLTGKAPLPQMFSLGYHQCRWNYYNESEVQEIHENFDLYEIPLDTVWLDIEYTDGKRYFTWNATGFPTPLEMIRNLTDKERKLIVIIDPHIKRDDNYFLHTDATRMGLYIKNKDNDDYEGKCWPGESSYLDFFNPAARDYYSKRYLLENFKGTTKDVYIWNDMNEPAVFEDTEKTMPKDNIHYGGWEHRQLHNGYGLMHTMGTYEGLVARSNGTLRPFILTRSAFAGSQRYTAIWTGDNIADWSFLRLSVSMCLSLAVSGLSFCGADVGGFFNHPEAELMTRWYQAAAFQPFYRSHSITDNPRREPWTYNYPTTLRIRDAVRKRYSYMPFWYTLFFEHSFDGLPVMRPIFMNYPEESNVFGLDDQYMLSTALLVHPVAQEGVSSVEIVIPGTSTDEIWYDIDNYDLLRPGKLNFSVDINKIPVFQRGGSIVPKKEKYRRSSGLMKDDPYTLIVALTANLTAEGTIYIDDEESFKYKEKEYIYARMSFRNDSLTFELIHTDAFYPSEAEVEKVVIVGKPSAPEDVKLISSFAHSQIDFEYDDDKNILILENLKLPVTKGWKLTLV